MTEEQIVLAKRAVACKGFRWMPGMLTTDDERMSGEGWPDYEVMDFGASSVVETVEWRDRAKRTSLPDLQDPATLGCLLALVRQAWERPSGTVRCWSMDRWYWDADYEDGHVSAKRFYWTEAEALVAALEAAP